MSIVNAERAPDFFDCAGQKIAFRRVQGDGDRPGLVFLGGFKSDMKGGKAVALEAFAAAQGRSCLRFDYSGHGESSGRFDAGTIGLWLAQSLSLIRAQTRGPQILIGSSMGGWLALLAARALADGGEAARIAGLVLIAPAVDFTQDLMWPSLPDDARQAIEKDGVWLRASQYSDEPTPITRALIEEGRNHLLFGKTIRSYGPCHILQGMEDPDVPWRHALKLVEHMPADPVALTLIRDGDHRLSRDEDLARLIAAVDQLI